MLGAHPDCICVPEMQFKIDIAASWKEVHSSGDIAETLETIIRSDRFRVWWGLNRQVRALPSEVSSSRDLIEWFVRAYGADVGKPAPSIWIDHSPNNLRYAASLLDVFPDAHFIHIVRDGRAVAASTMVVDWGPSEIIDAARFWLQALSYGLAAELDQSARVTRVRYEDLVLNTPVELERVCQEVGIPFEGAMVEGAGFKVPPYSAKPHALVGMAATASRVRAWEEDLTPREIEIFESITGDVLRYLGYVPRFGLKAAPPSTVERYVMRAKELYKRGVVKRLRKRRRVRAALKARLS
jgi:hypothetical protein